MLSLAVTPNHTQLFRFNFRKRCRFFFFFVCFFFWINRLTWYRISVRQCQIKCNEASCTASQVPTSYIVGRNFTAPWYLALCELWVLDHLFLGVVRTSHGEQRKKVGNRNFLRWMPIYVAQSHWLTAASRNPKANLRSPQQQCLLRMSWSRNLMRWDGRFTSCDFSDVQQLAGNSQSVVPKKTDYAIATVKEVLTLAQSAASVIPVPFLKEAIGIALKIIQLCEVRWIPSRKVANDWSNSILGSIGCWTKSQRAAS